MKFRNKVKLLEKKGLGSLIKAVNHENESITFQSDKGLISTSYDRPAGTSIEVQVYTRKELIERETETIVSSYFTELINQLNKPEWVDKEMVDVLVGTDEEQEVKARKFVISQLDSNDKGLTNSLLRVEQEILIADKLYLFVI